MRGVNPFVVGVLVVLAGCSDITYEGGGPLRVELTSVPTSATVDQTVEFTVAAWGSVLSRAIIAYGDGVADTVAASGAQSMSARRDHVFLAPGSYTVVATVEDVAQGTMTAEITIPVVTP